MAGCVQKQGTAKDRFSANEENREELVLAIGGEPDEGFDPTAGWGRYGSPLFQSTLFSYDADLAIQHDLATGYETSKDGLEWTIEIRDDVKFSDGKNLTASDVLFTYLTAQKSGSVLDLNNMKRVEKVDAYTVKFVLKKPESSFVHRLAETGIVPEHAYNKQYNAKPIGSGPYQLVQWDKGQQLIVKENPYYYRKKPFFKQLTFLFLSEDAALAAAQAGEADIVSVPPALAKRKIPGMKMTALESVDNRGIMFPYESAGKKTETGVPVGNDVTADLAIRRAINIGIDRQALVEGILGGFGTPAYSVADRLPWWNADTVFKDADLNQANEILEKAGWIRNDQGVRMKHDLEAAFTLYYPAGDQLRQSLSIAAADAVKPLGIRIKTEGKSWDELERLMHANPVMMGWGSHNPLEMYHLYSSDTKGAGYYNANFYENTQVDDYIKKAIYATTQDEANAYWKKAQWDGDTGFSALGDAPWAWLVNVKHVYFIRENLDIGKQKIQPHGHGWPITDFIESWRWSKKEG